jgi:CDP-6-deoxy-D-xylo-4-hexulose-3-dehydrase
MKQTKVIFQPFDVAATSRQEIIRREIANLVQEYADLEYAPQPFLPGKTLVPVSGKVLGASELQHMVEASLDGWLTNGRFNNLFEKSLEKFLGVKHVITVNSGSSANLVAFFTLTSPKLGDRAIKPGDEVIGVAAGFPTTINPILQYGAVPVFVDVDLATHNIQADLIEAAITPKTKAIMLAHALGNPFNLEVVTQLCQRYGLWLVEDCCDALGATYDGRQVGSFGDISTLSFYPAHHITMGEGGAVFTNNGTLKLIAESFRDWGRDCFCAPGEDNTCGKRFCWTKKKLGGNLPDGYDHKYIYSHLGYNLKITDMQAACGLAQMDRLEGFIAKRRANFNFLRERLEGCKDFLQLPEATPKASPSWFGFPVVLKKNKGFSREQLLVYLNDHKIGTRLFFAGNVTKQPYMMGRNYRISGELKNTDVVMNQTFWLGIYPALGPQQLDYIASKLEEFFRL